MRIVDAKRCGELDFDELEYWVGRAHARFKSGKTIASPVILTQLKK